MPHIDARSGEVVIRIVYDGAPEAGKTTNVQQLSSLISLQRRGASKSPGTKGERTEFFDWLDFTGGYLDGRRVRCQLVSVPGQSSLLHRRRYLLETADAIVFVADSRHDMFEDAATNFSTTLRILERVSRGVPVGVIVQANKQDLPGALAPDAVLSALGAARPVLTIGSVASSGDGVMQTFILAVRLATDRVRTLLLDEVLSDLPMASETPDGLHTAMVEIEALSTPLAEVSSMTKTEANGAESESRTAEAVHIMSDVGERPETERITADRAEAERIAAERADAERKAAEAERIAAERADAERKAAEAERIAAERADAERKAAEAQRIAAERADAERKAAEAERIAAERADAERKGAAARAEAERIAAERADAERKAAEAQRIAAERADAKRTAATASTEADARADKQHTDEDSARDGIAEAVRRAVARVEAERAEAKRQESAPRSIRRPRPNRMDADAIPMIPDATEIASGHVWPPVKGRASIAFAADGPFSVLEVLHPWAPSEAHELLSDSGWVLHTADRWRFDAEPDARRRLLTLVRDQLGRASSIPDGRALAVAADAAGWRLWLVTPRVPSVLDGLLAVLAEGSVGKVAAYVERTLAGLRELGQSVRIPAGLAGLTIHDTRLGILGLDEQGVEAEVDAIDPIGELFDLLDRRAHTNPLLGRWLDTDGIQLMSRARGEVRK